MRHVLIVDDDPATRSALVRLVGRAGHSVSQAASAAEARTMIGSMRIDLVITDMEMPGGTGFQVLEAGLDAEVPVVILTAHASVEMAVDAMKRGAKNFLTKPFSSESVGQVLQEVFDPKPPRRRTPQGGVPTGQRDGGSGRVQLVGANDGVPQPVRDGGSNRIYTADGQVQVVVRDRGSGPISPIGEDDAFRTILTMVERVADTDATILLTGESGTGKEVVARAIHNASKRRDKPFVAINCGAIPEALLESELFGHVKGAFTGATATRRGRFAAAEGGTLFLDEIADMPLHLQVKLLRVIQERQFEMLGDSKPLPANVRFIAATNRNIEELVARGGFRDDLFYRLNVVPLHLPPLRDRVRDIPLLVQHFIAEANAAHWRQITGISSDALSLLTGYFWPGNVRELCNVVERMVVLRGQGLLTVEDVPPQIRSPRAGARAAGGVLVDLPPSGMDLSEALQRFEGVLIDKALERTKGNRTQAAALLRINRTTLVEKLKRIEGAEGEEK